VFSKLLLGNDFLSLFVVAGNASSKPLLSNGRPLWLHYSSFQASCHNTKDIDKLKKEIESDVFQFFDAIPSSFENTFLITLNILVNILYKVYWFSVNIKMLNIVRPIH
jgi:hypothetical protein